MTRRHPLHSICPYFAMFPEDFVERHVLAHTRPGDTVFDPFVGRGTTVFQSLLMGRESFGIDVNPVAACIAGAKANPASLVEVLQRIDHLESGLDVSSTYEPPTPFFSECFHRETLSQVLYLRKTLEWKTNRVDRFIAAMTLAALHGESHRSAWYLSNRMPRTISTKPEYSIRWWRKNNLTAPKRCAFEILRNLARFRLRIEPPALRGEIALGDARDASNIYKSRRGRVRLVVTSPPYFDVTDYAEDQWLRLWFLGGEPSPRTKIFRDDRYTQAAPYWQFLQEAWQGVSSLIGETGTMVVRIGGYLDKEEIGEGLIGSLEASLTPRVIKLRGNPVTTRMRRRQTNIFRPGTKARAEHDFVFEIA